MTTPIQPNQTWKDRGIIWFLLYYKYYRDEEQRAMGEIEATPEYQKLIEEFNDPNSQGKISIAALDAFVGC